MDTQIDTKVICTRENIAHLAYCIWEVEGRPLGKAIEHWLEAEAMLKHADRGPKQSPRRTQVRSFSGSRKRSAHRLDTCAAAA